MGSEDVLGMTLTNILARLELFVLFPWKNAEGVGTEVVTLR